MVLAAAFDAAMAEALEDDDEGIDFESMGRIFTGLVKCGAWGCFDEFNRLKEDQLSAVSQQIQVIQGAIKGKEPTLSLLGKTIDVDHNAGIFVTMNPAGKKYGGRSTSACPFACAGDV